MSSRSLSDSRPRSLWSGLIGQDDVIVTLQAAVRDAHGPGESGPAMTHAWLVTGPPDRVGPVPPRPSRRHWCAMKVGVVRVRRVGRLRRVVTRMCTWRSRKGQRFFSIT